MRLRICYLSDNPRRLENARTILKEMEAGNILESFKKFFVTDNAEYWFINCGNPKACMHIQADQAIIDYRTPVIETAKRITEMSCVPEEYKIMDDKDIFK